MEKDISGVVYEYTAIRKEPPLAEGEIVVFSERVKLILLAQPLNPLKKVNFNIVPRRVGEKEI